MSDAKLIETLEAAFRGIATCATCTCCQGVAEMMLDVIERSRNEQVYEGDDMPGPRVCPGGICGEE